MRTDSARRKGDAQKAKKMRSETFLATGLSLMLIWEAGFAFLHIGGAPIHWLPVFAVIFLVLYLLNGPKTT